MRREAEEARRNVMEQAEAGAGDGVTGEDELDDLILRALGGLGG